jgi:hypothetical protein
VTRITVLAVVLAAGLVPAQQSPKLKDTTDWLHDFIGAHGRVENENWVDTFHITFNGCSATVVDDSDDISCTRPENEEVCQRDKRILRYVHRFIFNLKDFEPTASSDDFSWAPNHGVMLEVRNERPLVKIVSTSGDRGVASAGTDHYVSIGVATEDGSRRVVEAFNHAIKLCGGKPSPF